MYTLLLSLMDKIVDCIYIVDFEELYKQNNKDSNFMLQTNMI